MYSSVKSQVVISCIVTFFPSPNRHVTPPNVWLNIFISDSVFGSALKSTVIKDSSAEPPVALAVHFEFLL